ncbi:hypothetical protein [Streptomyces sp. NPDC001222]|uniref:hypothetical protein n=1 Tax=Streptomyces sp. NPDC001222 TaxID=3364548 RepID=UPI0036AECDA9
MTVHDGPGDMILAGVAHNNPNYDPGWVPFFAALVLLAGFVIVLVGGAMSIGPIQREQSPDLPAQRVPYCAAEAAPNLCVSLAAVSAS